MKYVYLFKEGNKNMRDILGGKGANLAEMTNMNLPVPNGFTISTDACKNYYKENGKISKTIKEEILKKVDELEKIVGKKFGDINNPLLVSVRSGSPISMPGMMDTILNLGLNDEVAETLIRITNNKRFVYDSYRRLIMMYANVVKGYETKAFEEILTNYKKEKNVETDIELDENDLFKILKDYKKTYKKITKEEFPQDINEQLMNAIEAVFKSWNNERAIVYRKLNNIDNNLGTAVNIQQMVYGNMGENSLTGVAFSRNPATGEKELYGEYLINAQGEDVVAGIRTPNPIKQLEKDMPKIYKEFMFIAKKLEIYYKDVQDIEFTVENGKLYILQTRNAKRTGQAAVKIAVNMQEERIITKEEAIMRIEPKQLNQLLHKTFNKDEINKAKEIGKGLGASPGAASGKIYFSAKDLKIAKERKEETILVREETSPEDIEGMNDANGILTIRGGMTSHAAVVARGMGKCCVSGCNLSIDLENKTLTTQDGYKYKEGDFISIDGETGKVYEGIIETIEPLLTKEFKKLLDWADSYKKLKVRANADNKKDAEIAKKYNAEGIGLCRTEHMFFEKERIFNFRKMILSETREERIKALNKILPYQRKDFEELFEAMDGYPVIIRYLDPPLHEFLPKESKEINRLSQNLNVTYENIMDRINKLKEFNPMMGHRGCRLLITYPEITIMQTQAVIEAAINASIKGIKVKPEIMIPLVSNEKELIYISNIIRETADKIISTKKVKIKYSIGSMIETPRAASTTETLAKYAEFFSFGTNDLTQMTFGFSRDDSSKFINTYYDKNILAEDPFVTIDKFGVGKLVKSAIVYAKKTNPKIDLGICGEHAADEKSIEFFNEIGLNYISCSPYRIPLAKLAAAQAAIKARKN